MMPQDKLIHLLGCFAVFTILARFVPAPWAVGVTLALGAAKELIYDGWMKKGTPERNDWWADVAGVLLGWVVKL